MDGVSQTPIWLILGAAFGAAYSLSADHYSRAQTHDHIYVRAAMLGLSCAAWLVSAALVGYICYRIKLQDIGLDGTERVFSVLIPVVVRADLIVDWAKRVTWAVFLMPTWTQACVSLRRIMRRVPELETLVEVDSDVDVMAAGEAASPFDFPTDMACAEDALWADGAESLAKLTEMLEHLRKLGRISAYAAVGLVGAIPGAMVWVWYAMYKGVCAWRKSLPRLAVFYWVSVVFAPFGAVVVVFMSAFVFLGIVTLSVAGACAAFAVHWSTRLVYSVLRLGITQLWADFPFLMHRDGAVARVIANATSIHVQFPNLHNVNIPGVGDRGKPATGEATGSPRRNFLVRKSRDVRSRDSPRGERHEGAPPADSGSVSLAIGQDEDEASAGSAHHVPPGDSNDLLLDVGLSLGNAGDAAQKADMSGNKPGRDDALGESRTGTVAADQREDDGDRHLLSPNVGDVGMQGKDLAQPPRARVEPGAGPADPAADTGQQSKRDVRGRPRRRWRRRNADSSDDSGDDDGSSNAGSEEGFRLYHGMNLDRHPDEAGAAVARIGILLPTALEFALASWDGLKVRHGDVHLFVGSSSSDLSAENDGKDLRSSADVSSPALSRELSSWALAASHGSERRNMRYMERLGMDMKVNSPRKRRLTTYYTLGMLVQLQVSSGGNSWQIDRSVLSAKAVLDIDHFVMTIAGFRSYVAYEAAEAALELSARLHRVPKYRTVPISGRNIDVGSWIRAALLTILSEPGRRPTWLSGQDAGKPAPSPQKVFTQEPFFKIPLTNRDRGSNQLRHAWTSPLSSIVPS